MWFRTSRSDLQGFFRADGFAIFSEIRTRGARTVGKRNDRLIATRPYPWLSCDLAGPVDHARDRAAIGRLRSLMGQVRDVLLSAMTHTSVEQQRSSRGEKARPGFQQTDATVVRNLRCVVRARGRKAPTALGIGAVAKRLPLMATVGVRRRPRPKAKSLFYALVRPSATSRDGA